MVATDPTTTEPRQFSIRLPHWGWFLLGTVILVVVAVALLIWVPYHREQQFVEKVESWGGSAWAGPVGYKWLQKVLRIDRMKQMKVFDRIVSIELDDTAVTDFDLAHVGECTDLAFVSINGKAITTVNLTHLSRCKNLIHLELDRTTVNDSGLTHLKGLTNIEYLSLKGTAVTRMRGSFI